MKRIEDDTPEIKEALKGFYAALRASLAGEFAPMEEVWSHEDDVTYLGPQGEILMGWNQVSNAWRGFAKKKMKGSVDIEDVHICLEGNIGIVQNYEVGSHMYNGKLQPVKVRATNIFRKEDDGWKMITHQTDLLPFLKDQSL